METGQHRAAVLDERRGRLLINKGLTGFDWVEPDGNAQRVVAYHAKLWIGHPKCERSRIARPRYVSGCLGNRVRSRRGRFRPRLIGIGSGHLQTEAPD